MEQRAKQYFFYVLRCADATFYTGFTTDLKQRLMTHNSGRGAKYLSLIHISEPTRPST